jgi:hypothetical protein
MSPRLSDDILYRIRVRLERGDSISRIYNDVKMSKTAIRNISNNLELFREPYPPRSIILGRPRALLPAQEIV